MLLTTVEGLNLAFFSGQQVRGVDNLRHMMVVDSVSLLSSES